MKDETNNRYNVRNVLVHEDKNSDFLEFYRTNDLLKKCPFYRAPFRSGPYYIYTLDEVHDEERNVIRDHQDEWM